MKTVDVLIVEDNEWLARQYGRVLERAGFSSKHASHALAAIDLIDTVQPSAIVLDMLLSVTTGMTLLHELQSHDDLSKIPVIVVTNLAEDLQYEDLKPYGVVALLDKATMQPDEIALAIKRVLR